MSNETESAAKIIVIGVGGAGNNAVNRMVADTDRRRGVRRVSTQTSQALKLYVQGADNALQIGEKVTKGLGAGAKPEVGEQAAEESAEEIRQASAQARGHGVRLPAVWAAVPVPVQLRLWLRSQRIWEF